MIVFLLVLGLVASSGVFARFFWERRRVFVVFDPHEATVAGEILHGLESNVDLKEIEKEAIHQNVEPEVFVSATEKAQTALSEGKNKILDSSKFFAKNTVFLIISAIIFVIFLFMLLGQIFGNGAEKADSQNLEKSKTLEETKEIIRVKVRKNDKTNEAAGEKPKVKVIDFDENLRYEDSVSGDFLMEIELVSHDTKTKGSVVGGFIAKGLIKMNDLISVLDENQNRLMSSQVKEIFTENRSGGKKYFQMAQNGQNVNILLEDVIDTEEAPYYLIKSE